MAFVMHGGHWHLAASSGILGGGVTEPVGGSSAVLSPGRVLIRRCHSSFSIEPQPLSSKAWLSGLLGDGGICPSLDTVSAIGSDSCSRSLYFCSLMPPGSY